MPNRISTTTMGRRRPTGSSEMSGAATAMAATMKSVDRSILRR
jgi:hypothetical protein